MIEKPSTSSPGFRTSPDADSPFWSNISVEVDAFLIGAPKCATKWLAECLRANPTVHIPGECNGLTQHADEQADYYNNFFNSLEVTPDLRKLTIDYSNTYMLDATLPRKMKDRFGPVKLVFCYRDPVERAFSHYLMDLTYGVFEYDAESGFREAVCHPRLFSYYDFGLYLRHIAPIADEFLPENLLLIDVAAIERDPQRVYERLCNFLSIPYNAANVPANKRNTWEEFQKEHGPGQGALGSRPVMKEDDRKWLWQFYRQEHRDFEEWNATPRERG